ncbi:MAG: DNA methyltransferase [bacterium]
MEKSDKWKDKFLNKITQGDCLELLKELPDESIDCVITSPPYWGLRDYGVNEQLGLEPTFKEYINNICNIFDEVKRVLKKTGTCWVNIADTYWGGGNNRGNNSPISDKQSSNRGAVGQVQMDWDGALPNKCLVGIPERFVIEMTDRGWIRRNTIIWHKPNCMPTSAGDRFTVDFEYLYFFAKSTKYCFERQFEPLCLDIKKRAKTNNNSAKSDTQDSYISNENTRKYFNKVLSGKIQGRNMRTVWTIPTQSYSEAHFACVTPDTEILTIDGWKKYTDIKWYGKSSPQHILVATYNIKKKTIEYQPLSYIREYDFNGKLIKIGNRDLDVLMTPNHRNIVKKKIGKEEIVLADKLAYLDKIRVHAPIKYPETSGIGRTFAELIGWIISEGHYKKGGYIELYQNEGNSAKRIDYLLRKLEISHTRKLRNKIYRGQNKGQVTWFLKKSPLIEWCLANIKYKQLNKFLVSLPLTEVRALFNGLIAGDGHKRKDDGRLSFVQNNKQTKDWFQILAFRLGYHSMQKGNTIYLTKRTHIGIRKTNGCGKNIKKINYDGKVWCPKTKNGTWVARRNGKIFITGNTFPERLIEIPIKAGCPEKICRKCGKAREMIIAVDYVPVGVKSNNEKYAENTPSDNTNPGPAGMRHGRARAIRNTAGYTDCGCNAGYNPGVVLDLFMGSGTTALVALKLNRNFIGFELSQKYIDMADKRIQQELRQGNFLR